MHITQNMLLLQKWNQTHCTLPEDMTVIELFEQQVQDSPDNPAVRYAGTYCSYQQLNERANQLAHYLLSLKTQHGWQHNPLIAILLEHSHIFIIAVLATLKAGGAYIPLDPNYPAERTGYMLDDSGAPVLFMQSALKTTLSLDETKCAIICLDASLGFRSADLHCEDFVLPKNGIASFWQRFGYPKPKDEYA